MVARLISLADAFDAMSSTRTYRPALSRPAAMKEILDFAGTQFDPEFAPIFVKLDFSEYDRMFAEHQTPEQQASGETEEAA
jgi:HD-GYP domain-containing protein (c-di-GMP phosphodiesterase class II)